MLFISDQNGTVSVQILDTQQVTKFRIFSFKTLQKKKHMFRVIQKLKGRTPKGTTIYYVIPKGGLGFGPSIIPGPGPPGGGGGLAHKI